MTAPDFAAMTDAELAAEAAGRMGWTIDSSDPFDDPCYVKADIFAEYVYAWGPADSLTQSALLGAAFLARWPDECSIGIALGSVCSVVICGGEYENAWSITVSNASEARARTVATLRAWTALEGEA